MAYAFVQSGTNSHTAGTVGLATSSITVTAGNTLLFWSVNSLGDGSNPPTGNGNTFVSVGFSPQIGGSSFGQLWICQNANAGATVVAQSTGVGYGVWLEEISGLVSTGGTLGFISSLYAAPSGTGANVLTSGNINVATVPAGLFGLGINAQNLDQGAGSNSGPAPLVGTSLAYTGRTVGWLGSSAASVAAAEDIRVTSTGNIATTFGISADQFNNFIVMAVAIAEASPPSLYDGTTASGTTVATGTGGTACAAFSVGDCIHVLLMAQTASALTEGGPSDGSNTYTHLQTFNDHANGFIFDRWMAIITTPLATPVITATWSGTAKLAIAAAKLTNINTGAPNVAGGNAQNFQTAPSGSNAQISGPAGSVNPLVPVTVAAWGFSTSETAAPAAGSGFTQVGTAWAALGAACLTYETQTSNNSLQQTATFTPVTGNAYTFMDVFNQIGSHPPTVPPSGPMPRQIYIMP